MISLSHASSLPLSVLVFRDGNKQDKTKPPKIYPFLLKGTFCKAGIIRLNEDDLCIEDLNVASNV